MKPKVNIVALVDVIGALSEQSLLRGNLCMVDDSAYESTGQGTPELCTLVLPGQSVEWSALAVDVQTPLVIRSITFLNADGTSAPSPPPAAADDGEAAENPQQSSDALVWSGTVPFTMAHGVPYRYRLELQMDQGPQSVLSIDAPALMRP
jgi:hypothetical protein